MIFFWAFFLVVVCFGFVLLYGAPYVPTHSRQANVALDLLDLNAGQIFYELGCGDGKILIMASKRGYKVIGVELNPIMYIVAKIRTLKYSNISVKYGNFWVQDLSNADGVFVFLLDKFMPKLDKKLEAELKPGAKLASYAFKIPNKKALLDESGVFIYKY